MANIASDSISVFPTVNRGDGDQLGRSQRLFTEQNVRDIANMVNSKDSYVIQITTLTKNNTGVSCVEFCLDGYHVFAEIDAIAKGQDDGKLVYAKADYDGGSLKSDDSTSHYDGITFTVQAPDATAPADSLLLGTIATSGSAKTISLAKESKIMYDGDRVDAASLDAASIQSINLTLIDGGTI